jgi:hypothetical protein
MVIAPKPGKKGRSFTAVLLASVEADLLWSGGMTDTDNQRPVWAMFGGSENELRAFMANLMSGRIAVFPKSNGYSRSRDECVEILRSAGYRIVWQREAEGALATIYLPDLFQIDPGLVDPEGIKFILLPTQAWVDEQRIDPYPLISHAQRSYDLPDEQLASWVSIAHLFIAYLDRRTRCPLVADGRFFLQLMLACLRDGLASFTTDDTHYYYRNEKIGFGIHPQARYYEKNTSKVGLSPGLVFSASHERFEKLLAEEVSLYFQHAQGVS